jgi:RND superfamily putative drug exporter
MFPALASRSSARPWRAFALVLVFVVLAGIVGGPVAGRLSSGGDAFTARDAESSRATARIEAATGRAAEPGGITLLVRDATASDVRGAGSRLREVPGIAAVQAPAGTSRDGHRALITGTLRADADDADVSDAAIAAFEDDPRVVVGGSAVAGEQIGSTVTEDLGRAELLAFPILALLSLVFFRGRAALVPLVVGVVTVLGTFLVLSAVDLVYDLNVFALNLVIGLGLGLAIDYTLFLITRFREELDDDHDVGRAVAATMATAGRTVAFSAATVAVALATLTIFPQGFAKSMGIAGASVAVVAALAALLVTPAFLGLWGRRLARSGALRGPAPDGRWERIARLVMRRPAPVATVTALAMLALATPALGVRWAPVDADVIPKGQSARTVADAVVRDFPDSATAPVVAVLEGPSGDRRRIAGVADEIRRVPGVVAVRTRRAGQGIWTVSATVPGDPAGSRAQSVVRDVRELRTSVPLSVTGPAARFVDQQRAITSALLPAGLLLAGLTFVVLWLMTGSVLLPLKAILMNVLTVGASLAPLVLIYQDGRLEGLLGYTSSGGIETTNFLVTAALIFALSTDYGVFLLGRIKEAHDAGLPTREAVAVGIGRTGRVVTAAAILLAVAIGAFSTSSISFIQQIGIATATGVLLDAFVVRSLLVPSLMALMGRWNWWSPAPLRRLHARVGISETAPTH